MTGVFAFKTCVRRTARRAPRSTMIGRPPGRLIRLPCVAMASLRSMPAAISPVGIPYEAAVIAFISDVSMDCEKAPSMRPNASR